jgi:hypothetical protein
MFCCCQRVRLLINREHCSRVKSFMPRPKWFWDGQRARTGGKDTIRSDGLVCLLFGCQISVFFAFFGTSALKVEEDMATPFFGPNYSDCKLHVMVTQHTIDNNILCSMILTEYLHSTACGQVCFDQCIKEGTASGN